MGLRVVGLDPFHDHDPHPVAQVAPRGCGGAMPWAHGSVVSLGLVAPLLLGRVDPISRGRGGRVSRALAGGQGHGA